MMFRIPFLQFFYEISGRRIEEEVNFNLVLKGRQGTGKQGKWYNILIDFSR
jgi:hypothetical protein